MSQSVGEPLRDSIQAAYRQYAEKADKMLAMIGQGAVREAKQYYYDDVRHISDRLRNFCFQLFEFNQTQMYNAEATTHTLANQAAYGVMMAAIIALVLSVAATAWLTKVVIEPAERLTQTVKQIGRGKLDLKIDVLSNDEIGQLSREFNKMTERLRQYEQMNIEQILSEKRKSEAIVATISDGLMVTDAGGTVLLVNQTIAEIYGLSETAAIGRPAASVLADERVLALLAAARTGAPERTEAALTVLRFDRDGVTRYYRPKVSRIVAEDGGLYGLLLLLQDVTQFKELDRLKSDFVATLSHEFRTPVTSISMSVDILNRGILGPLNDRQRELINAAKDDCVRLTKLSREFLQLSKLEAGEFQLKDEELDVEAVVESSLRPLRLQFEEKSISLAVQLAGGIPHVRADEQAVASVITNLVTNAFKHTDSGGSVTVAARLDGPVVRFEIRDSGQGIPPEHLRDIFDKFVQVKQASDATPGSVGLGLAIAKEIVELHGGKIWAESVPGRGSTFLFTLPVGGRPVQDEQRTTHERHSPAR
jgi:PAS domain S-box-containing protein